MQPAAPTLRYYESCKELRGPARKVKVPATEEREDRSAWTARIPKEPRSSQKRLPLLEVGRRDASILLSHPGSILTPSGLRPRGPSIPNAQDVLHCGRHPATARSSPTIACPGKNFTCLKIRLESRRLESHPFCGAPLPHSQPGEEPNLSHTHLSKPFGRKGNTDSPPGSYTLADCNGRLILHFVGASLNPVPLPGARRKDPGFITMLRVCLPKLCSVPQESHAPVCSSSQGRLPGEFLPVKITRNPSGQ